MQKTPQLDLACFSYLAAARIVRVDHYPEPNHGAEINSVDESVNGDGPLVAAFASGLGLTTALEANAVADDADGRRVEAFLDRHRVARELAGSVTTTPLALVLVHPDGNREWLVEFEATRFGLAAVSGRLLAAARLAYVDCYASIPDAAARALGLAAEAGVPLYVNLGGAPAIPVAVDAALRRFRPVAIQDNRDEAAAGEAEVYARSLHERYDADLVLVTVGERGAVALEGALCVRAPARVVDVDYTNGAGAAFAAGMIFARTRGRPLREALKFACALGSLQCTATRMEAPSADAVEAFIAATEPAA
jgi:sugar/nucleoside kinase (ribokinase family)